MANVKIWYHDGFSRDLRGWPTPVVNEPSLIQGDIAEIVATPGASNDAPADSVYAIIETDEPIRYTVRNPGDDYTLASTNHKKISQGNNAISVTPGQTIHFIEA